MPNTALFDVSRPADAICAGNDKAISIDIDIDASEGLTITFCSLLEYELDGSFRADGLLNEYEEEGLGLSLQGDFKLYGALKFGSQINVIPPVSLMALPQITIDFDPISAQLNVAGGIDAVASFSLLEAVGDVNAQLNGEFALAYCTNCGDDYDGSSTYTRLSETSNFYLRNEVGYSILGNVGIQTAISGLELATGLEFGVGDSNIFDPTTSVAVTLPDAGALQDSLKFTPANALFMLQVIDGVSLHNIFFVIHCTEYTSNAHLIYFLTCSKSQRPLETRH